MIQHGLARLQFAQGSLGSWGDSTRARWQPVTRLCWRPTADGAGASRLFPRYTSRGDFSTQSPHEMRCFRADSPQGSMVSIGFAPRQACGVSRGARCRHSTRLPIEVFQRPAQWPPAGAVRQPRRELLQMLHAHLHFAQARLKLVLLRAEKPLTNPLINYADSACWDCYEYRGHQNRHYEKYRSLV